MTNYADIIYGTGEHPYECGIYCDKCAREKRKYKERRTKESKKKCPWCGKKTITHTIYSGEIVELCQSKKCRWAEK